MWTFLKGKNQNGKVTLLLIFMGWIFLPMHSIAQEVITPSGTRSMVQEEIHAVRGNAPAAKVDLSYTVAWEAKTCKQPRPYGTRPQAVAWVTDYTVEGVEYKDEYFSAVDIGQNTLKNGLEIVNLNSGIVAEVKNLESGRSDEIGPLNGSILAEPQKRDVCDMNATVISHHELSRGEYTVQIKNTEQERKNRLKISKDLHETIAYNAIDKKMEKAKAAANEGNKNSAQQIAMKARSLCPGGPGPFGPDMGRNPGDPATECEKEISEFLKGLSDASNTGDSSNFSASQSTDENSGRDQDEFSNTTDEESTASSGLGDDSENTSVSSSGGNVSSNSNNQSVDNGEGVSSNPRNEAINAREAEKRKAIDEHNDKILKRAQAITDQAESLMWGDEKNKEFNQIEGEIGTYNRMIGALEERRMDNLSPKEKQELETYLLSMNAAKVLATLAGGGNLLDSEASLEGAVEAGVNLLDARAERKAAEREVEEKRKKAIQKMKKERKERKRELQRRKERETQNRMQHFSNNVLDPFDKRIIGQPVNQDVKKVKSHYASSHESLQKGDLQRSIRHMERALNNLKDKESPEAGIIQYQLAWMYSEDDDLITAVGYAQQAPELMKDTPAEDIVTEFANGIDKAYEKQERQDYLAQKRTGIPEKLEDYLDKYPQGEYKDEAENLIKEWRMERQKKMQSLKSSYQYHEEKEAKHGRKAGISIAWGIGIPLIAMYVASEEDENGDLQVKYPGVTIGALPVFVTGIIVAINNANKMVEHNQKALNIEQQMKEFRKQKFSANIKFNTKHDTPLLGLRVNF